MNAPFANFISDPGGVAREIGSPAANASIRIEKFSIRFVSKGSPCALAIASAILLLLFALWRPIPQTVWDVSGSPLAASILWTFFALGWLVVLLSTFMIGHANLFGLQQVWQTLVGRMRGADEFMTPMFYGIVRHPIMVGFLIAFWATPVMTVGHLLFAVVTTNYILVATQIEERDLIAQFGHRYEDYRRRVRGFVPLPRRAASPVPSESRNATPNVQAR